jgi:hypothetical protein
MPQSTRRWITDKVEALRSAPHLPFYELLDPARVEHALEENQVSFRERVYNPLVTLWTFLPGLTPIGKKTEPVVIVWREPPPGSVSLSRSPGLTQNRLLFCLFPGECAPIPDVLSRLDREGCFGG